MVLVVVYCFLSLTSTSVCESVLGWLGGGINRFNELFNSLKVCRALEAEQLADKGWMEKMAGEHAASCQGRKRKRKFVTEEVPYELSFGGEIDDDDEVTGDQLFDDNPGPAIVGV